MDTMNGQRVKTPWLNPSEALNRPLNVQIDDTLVMPASTLQPEVATRRLGFYVGNIGLLVAQRAICELTDIQQICAIPNTAVWFLGLINLRGNLIPVFDLKMLLQLEEKQVEKKRMLLILGQGEAGGAIVIDGLPTHITLTNNDKLKTLPPLPAAIKPFATSGFEKNGEMWFNFDHLGFFQSLAAKVAR